SNKLQPVLSPIFTKTLENTNCQIYPSTIPPIRLGVKKPARKKFCPLIPLVNKYAIAKAITFTKTTTTITYLNVRRSDVQNSLSLITPLKFSNQIKFFSFDTPFQSVNVKYTP